MASAESMAKTLTSTDVVPKDISFPQLLYNRSSRYADRIALIDGASGEKYTYSDLWRNVRRFVAGLRLHGVKKGDRVCIVAANCIEYPVILLGFTSLGGVVVPLNPLYTADELLYFVQNSEPTTIVTSQEALGTVLKVSHRYRRIQHIWVLGTHSDYTTYEDLLRLGDGQITDAEDIAQPLNPTEDLLSLLYSSGTTGASKGCMHTHYNIIANLLQLAFPDNSIFEQGRDVTIATVPFSHSYGMMVLLSLGLYQGCTLVVMKRFHFEKYLHLVENYRATVLIVAPPIVMMIGQSPLANERRLSSVRRIVCSASTLKAFTLEQLRKKLPETAAVYNQYGATECMTVSQTGTFTVQGKTEYDGQKMPFVQIKVTDLTTKRSLGPNEDGEICIRSPANMIGYWRKPETTKEVFDEEQYIRTGDIGHYDRNGDLYIVDKLKDVMKYNGFQVNPTELESIIMTHSEVLDVAVVGTPHPSSGELPTAFVIAKSINQQSNGKQITELKKNIIDYLDAKVAPWKKLRGGVRLVEEIPKSQNGKVLRRLLRQLLMEEQQKEHGVMSKL